VVARWGTLDPQIIEFQITDAEIADLIAFLESLTDEGFLTDPAFANPWPEGHSATGAGATLPEDPS
jgi:cytochrome c peroxidase